MKNLRPFHLAIPVTDINLARRFYGGTLNLIEGRSDKDWIDYNFYGHQLVCHISSQTNIDENIVDGKNVPIPHFGIILDVVDFETLHQQLEKSNISFKIKPYIRFFGKPGEQKTMFFQDPFGNNLEFKAFKDDKQIFEN